MKIKKYKKYGLFAGAILLALGLSGCDVSEPNKEGAAKITEPDNTQKNSAKSDRIGPLNDSKEWGMFKKFWRELDNIAPKDKNAGNYSYSIDSDKVSSLKEDLKTILSSLEETGQLSRMEIDLLANICTARIDYFFFDFSASLSRMIPSPAIIGKEESIKDLEKRIDLLVALRGDKAIREDEFQQALAIVKEDIEKFSILEAITKKYVHYYSLGNGNLETSSSTIEQYIGGLEQHYAEYLKSKANGNSKNYQYQEDLNKRYKDTKEAIGQIKASLPGLNELIDDLERYDAAANKPNE